MKKVALITSGGDGSGINSAIEILSRNQDIDLYGFNEGFNGILNNEPIHLTADYCENRALDGRHLVRTARSKLPLTKEGRDKLRYRLSSFGFDSVIICGGNGTQKAARLLDIEGTKTIFIPMTIDNDVNGSEYSIGFDTALNHIIEVLSGLHDTAANMPGRIFMVEVLGGDVGNLALESAIGGACDIAIIPELGINHHKIARLVERKLQEKRSLIIVCSESAYEDKSYQAGYQGVSLEIAKAIEEVTKIRVRKSMVGYYIRSGKPSFRDARIASQMGTLAATCILNDESGVMIGVKRDRVQPIELKETINVPNELNDSLLEIAKTNNMLIL